MFPVAHTPPVYFALAYALVVVVVAVRATTLVTRDRWPHAVGVALLMSVVPMQAWFLYRQLPPVERWSSTLVFSALLLLAVVLGSLGHGRFLKRAWLERTPPDDPRLKRRGWVMVAQMFAAILLVAVVLGGHWDLFPGFVMPG